MRLRHSGILVKNLHQAILTYKQLGWKIQGPVQSFRVQKMRDRNGGMIELIEGEYHNHIAVNWVADEDGNWIELVEVKQ